MKEQVEAFGQRIWGDFRAFSPGQKAVTIVAVLALAIGGYVFATWKSKPAYAPLYTNLAPADASAIVDKLNTAGTPYQLAAAGTEILVPQSKVYSARLTMSAAGLPSSSQTGFPLLNKQGVTTSQFQQQIAYQSDLENQLDRTLDSMSGVQSAAVTLAIPQQDVFTDSSQKPTAAVLLTVDGGATLTSSQVQSVVYLVSSSVPGMSADDVTVTDSNGNVLNAPGQGLTSATSAASQTQATQDADARLAAQLQSMLTATLGAGNAQVVVNATLDFDQTDTTSNNYLYTKGTPPISQSSTTETYTGTGSIPSGTVGSSGTSDTSTDTTTTGSTGTGNGKYNNTTTTVNNALGTQTVKTTSSPGGIKQLAIGVLVNKSAKNVDVAAIEQMVKASAGFNAARGDTLSVTALPFTAAQTSTTTAATKAAAKAAAAQASQAHLVSLVKQGLLGVLVVGLVVGAWLTSRKRRKGQGGDPDSSNDFDPDLLPFTDAAPAGVGAAGPAGQHDNLNATRELTQVGAGRRTLLANAENRPEDFAQALSGWLNTRES